MNRKPVARVLAVHDATKLLRGLLGMLIFAVLTAVGAWVAIPTPLSPVPITMQTLVVGLSGALLGARWGALSQITYLFMGICGLPVFAGGLGGIAVVAGLRGGYLLAFPVAAWLTGYLTQRGSHFIWTVFSFFIGSLPVLIFGTLQLSLLTTASWMQALALGALPFVAGDFVKSVAGAGVMMARRRWKE